MACTSCPSYISLHLSLSESRLISDPDHTDSPGCDYHLSLWQFVLQQEFSAVNLICFCISDEMLNTVWPANQPPGKHFRNPW